MSIKNSLTSTVGRLSLKASSASPQLLFAAGIVGVGATVVLACRATLRVEEVLDAHDGMMVTTIVDEGDLDKKQKARVYAETGFQLVKLYTPAIICGVISVGALAGSHNILSKRNAGLTAAYGALDKAFKGYRDRVSNEVGEKRELELYNDVQICEIEDPVTGKKTKQKLTTGNAAYMFFWGEDNRNFDVLAESNYMFLKQNEIYANQRLQARGHLFLNEVLDSLGFEHTKAGAVTGWIRGEGDDRVDFGIFNDANSDRVIDFMNGREKGVWLNFNVDGTIYDRI